MSKVRTIMSGSATRSMTTAIVEIAAVPTKSVESSMMRTKRGVLGAPRKSSQRAANATVETESGRLLLLAESRCSQSEDATEPREPRLPQLVVDAFVGIHSGLYARFTRAD